MPTIPNTTITLHKSGLVYVIEANEGYVLHHSSRDWTETDPLTMEETFYRGYGRSSCSAPLNYNFDETTEIEGYTAYGRFEIFARPESEVPENQIFGGGNNDHETM